MVPYGASVPKVCGVLFDCVLVKYAFLFTSMEMSFLNLPSYELWAL